MGPLLLLPRPILYFLYYYKMDVHQGNARVSIQGLLLQIMMGITRTMALMAKLGTISNSYKQEKHSLFTNINVDYLFFWTEGSSWIGNWLQRELIHVLRILSATGSLYRVFYSHIF